MDTCAICGASLDDAPRVEWKALPGVAWHLACDWTPEGRAWFEQQRLTNSKLDRQVELSTTGLNQRCPECAMEQRVSPTGIFMAANSWDLNCDRCGQYWQDAINSTGNPEIFTELCRLREDFALGDWEAIDEERLIALDAQLSSRPSHVCPNGGKFSIGARVRCFGCTAPLPIGSWFHRGYHPPYARGSGKVAEEISALFAPLAGDERGVLLTRFGLDRGEPRTLQETADELALDVAEVSRLEASGLTKLRTER